jgi:predicted kinase
MNLPSEQRQPTAAVQALPVALTRARAAWITATTAALRQHPFVRGAWLVGSLATGTADPHGDVDLIVSVDRSTPPAALTDPVDGLRLPGTVLYTRTEPRNAPADGVHLAVCVELGGLPVLVNLHLWPHATAVVPAEGQILYSTGEPPPRSDLELTSLPNSHRAGDTTGADPIQPTTVLLLTHLAAKHLARGDQSRYTATARRLGLPVHGTPALRHILDHRIDLTAHPELGAAVRAVHRLLDLTDAVAPTAAPTLVLIRGNSGSGKTTTAREVRRRYGRGCALLEQDYLRRIMLREHDSSHIAPVAPAFISATAQTALSLGYHVVLEGILHTERYGQALRQLIDEHPGPSHVYYLDVTFDETVRRHQTRAEPINVTPDEMHQWYTARDLLGVTGEHTIAESATFEQVVTTILHTSGLHDRVPHTPCPADARDAQQAHRTPASHTAGLRPEAGTTRFRPRPSAGPANRGGTYNPSRSPKPVPLPR